MSSSRQRAYFSRRSAFDERLNRVALAIARAHEQRRHYLDLTLSNPTEAQLPYATDAIVESLASRGALSYSPNPFGMLSAREAISGHLLERELTISPESLMLTASTSEAYSFLFKLLADPGDDVLVPEPSYPLFEHLAVFESIRLRPYRLAYDGRWHVDLDSVSRAITPETRAIIVVSPNNPTGSYIKRDELDAIAAHGIPIIGDEVFARYSLEDDDARARSVLEARGVLTFALSGLSKVAAMPQMKAAWIAVGGPPADVTSAMTRLELIGDTFLSVSTPIQNALPDLLRHSRATERAIVARSYANMAVARGLFAPPSAASLLHAEGGWYVTVRLPRLISEEEWVISLFEQDGVLVHPGHFFDMHDEAYIVISLLTPETEFAEGMSRIARRVSDLSAP